MQKLFAVLLGGKAKGANLELHDVRFVVGETIEDTYEALRQQWFGLKTGLHLDAYRRLDEIDGYTITLSTEPPTQSERLYFINLGGYDSTKFVELHESGFFVGTSDREVKNRAKKLLLTTAQQSHKDNFYDIDQCLAISKVGTLHIHLHKNSTASAVSPSTPTWFGYRRIDR